MCLGSILTGNGYDFFVWAYAATLAYPLLLLGGFTKATLLGIGFIRFFGVAVGRFSFKSKRGVLCVGSLVLMTVSSLIGLIHGFVFLMVGSPLAIALQGSGDFGMALTIALTSDIGVIGLLGFEASRVRT